MFAKKKIKLHEIFLGLNTRNKYLSKYLWLIKSILPTKFGGLKLLDKKMKIAFDHTIFLIRNLVAYQDILMNS